MPSELWVLLPCLSSSPPRGPTASSAQTLSPFVTITPPQSWWPHHSPVLPTQPGSECPLVLPLWPHSHAWAVTSCVLPTLPPAVTLFFHVFSKEGTALLRQLLNPSVALRKCQGILGIKITMNKVAWK